MTLTYMSYEDQQAVMDGQMTAEEARHRACRICVDCGGAHSPEPLFEDEDCFWCGGELKPRRDLT